MNKIVPKSVSDTITMLRFPLIASVVLVHAYSIPENLTESMIGEGSQFLNLFIQSLFSDVFARIAVPLFFLISGYLIFYGKPITNQLIKRKWRSRINTLLIPYLIWNIVALGIQFIGQAIPLTSRFFTGSKFSIHTASFYSVADAFLGFDCGPINTPLWFLRDLMILTLLSPLIYYLVSKMGKYVIFIFVLVWLEIPNYIPIFISSRALLFFSLGMWLSMIEDKIKIKPNSPLYTIGAILYLSTAAIEAYLISQNYDLFFLHKFNIILGCLTIPILFYRVGQHPRIRGILTYLAATSFFVFLSHNIILQAIRKILYLIVDPNSGIDFLAIYFSSASITILILILIYEIFVNRWPIRLVKFSIGQRVTKR